MSTFARPPVPPYTAVIFTSTRTEGDQGYAVMGERMQALAKQQPGYLGYESARRPGARAHDVVLRLPGPRRDGDPRLRTAVTSATGTESADRG
ncbi:MAG: hypothetical protein JF565_13555 [Propionibacteriales bacterium]|nr:hypothetical protein [Propionibacteriales bacterium]